MFFRTASFALLVLLLFSISCNQKAVRISSTPAVIVNGDKLTIGELSKSLAKRLKVFDALAAKDPTNVRRSKDELVKEFIISTLLRQYALANHVSISDSEVEQEFDRVRKTYPDDLTFKAALAGEGVTFVDWKKKAAKSLLEKKAFAFIKNPEVTPSELNAQIKGYYDANKASFSKPEQVHLLQLVVAKEDDAERLLKKLKAGGSFAEMAKRYSLSPDAAAGGDVGYISRGVVPAFDNAFKLKDGQLSGVIKSTYGFHLLKLLDKKKASQLTLEQARPVIIKRLEVKRQQEGFNKWLEETIKSAKIVRNNDLIESLTVHTEGIEE